MKDKPTHPYNSGDDGQLTTLEFSPPYYESAAFYTNSKGQRFVVQVDDPDIQSLAQFTKEFRVDFEVLEDKALDLPEKKEGTPSYGEEANPSAEPPKPDSGLSIWIGVLEAEGIKPPFLFRFHIDPAIEPGKSQTYNFKDSTEGKVTITAVGGAMKATLTPPGSRPDGIVEVDVFRGTTPPIQGTVVGRVSTPTSFTLKVEATANSSRYSLSADIRKGAYDPYP